MQRKESFMSRKETNKNNVKTGHNYSNKSKHQKSTGSESIAVVEQPKVVNSILSRQNDTLRPSENTGQSHKSIQIPHELIEERAKAIWEQRGRPQGEDQSNWFEAENQLRCEFVGQE
jgi:hypothetical protein